VTIRQTAPAASSPVLILNGNTTIGGIFVDCFDGTAGFATIGVSSSGSSKAIDRLNYVDVKNASNSCVSVAGNGTKNSHILLMTSCNIYVTIPNYTIPIGIKCASGAFVGGHDVTISGFISGGVEGLLTDGMNIQNDYSVAHFVSMNITNVTNGVRVGNGVSSNSYIAYPVFRTSSLYIANNYGTAIILEPKSNVRLGNTVCDNNLGTFPDQQHLRINNPSLPADPNHLQLLSVSYWLDLMTYGGAINNQPIINGYVISNIPGDQKNSFIGDTTVGTVDSPSKLIVGEGELFRNRVTTLVYDGVSAYADISSRLGSSIVHPEAVNAATTTSIDLASAPATIDGFTPTSGVSRILVKDGSTVNTGATSVDNGVYIWNGTGNAMTRVGDFAAGDEVSYQTFFAVDQGTINYGSVWQIDSSAGDIITLATTAWGVVSRSSPLAPTVLTPGAALYIGSPNLFKFPGMIISLTKPLTTSSGTSVDIVAWEYWNGVSWMAMSIMSTDYEAPYSNHANITLGYGETMISPNIYTYNYRFGNISSWASNTINGTLAYWIRIRGVNVANVTQIPICTSIEFHTNNCQIGKDGFMEYFGTARPRVLAAINLNDLYDSGIQNPTSTALTATTSPNTIKASQLLNTFSKNQVRSSTIIWRPPLELDITSNLQFRFTASSGNAIGNVFLQIDYVYVADDDVIRDNSGNTTAIGKTPVTAIFVSSASNRGRFSGSMSLDISDLNPNIHTVWIMFTRQSTNVADTMSSNMYLHTVNLSMVKWCNGEYNSQ
jgi:hypothetical protein